MVRAPSSACDTIRGEPQDTQREAVVGEVQKHSRQSVFNTPPFVGALVGWIEGLASSSDMG